MFSLISLDIAQQQRRNGFLLDGEWNKTVIRHFPSKLGNLPVNMPQILKMRDYIIYGRSPESHLVHSYVKKIFWQSNKILFIILITNI